MKPRAVRGLLVAAMLIMPAAPASGQTSSGTDTAVGSIIGEVRGRFLDEVRTLPFAMVEASAGGVRLRSLTDASGRYRLERLPPGEVTLSVTHAGYQPLALVVAVPAGEGVSVDMELRARPVSIQPIDVLAGRSALGRGVLEANGETEIPELDMQSLDVGPGLDQAGMIDVISAVPGNDPGDARDVLFMRGSTTDMKLVLLDGAPIYTPFHVAGLMRSFEPAVLSGAELHVGGAPARFDGGLTQILELSTRTARRDGPHFSGSLDLLSAAGAVEIPLGGHAGLVASGRSLHDLASGPLGRDRPYGYHDALVAFDLEPASGHQLRATGFWNAEAVALDLQPARDDARWSNQAGSLAYRTDIGPAGLEVTAGLSGYRASLPLQPGARPNEPLPPPLLATALTNRARVVAELLMGGPRTPVRTGLSFEQIDAEFTAGVLGGVDGARSRGSTHSVGAFLDVTRPLAPDVSLRAGVRADVFDGRSARLAPRASIDWALAPEALLTVAVGRYHQPTRTPEVDVEQTLVDVAGGGVPSSQLLPIATADHVVLKLDQRLGELVRLGFQGFWKAYHGLPSSGGEGVRSSGVDVRVLRGSERGAVWLGYGLSWFWSTVDLAGRATDFSGRHLLSAGVSGRLGGRLRGEARVAYGAGLPYTSIPLGFSPSTSTVTSGPIPDRATVSSPFEPGLDESFLRLDAELYALFEPSWGDRSWKVRPYLRLLNALDRRDALFYAFEPWRSDAVRPLAELPILPLVGVAVSF